MNRYTNCVCGAPVVEARTQTGWVMEPHTDPRAGAPCRSMIRADDPNAYWVDHVRNSDEPHSPMRIAGAMP